MGFLIICILYLFQGRTAVSETSSTDTEFLVTFQENQIFGSFDPQQQCMSLMTFLSSDVFVEVHSLYPDIHYSKNISINNTTGAYVCLDNFMQLTGTGISRKVVRVTSTEHISVIVHDLEVYSADSYPAIPVEELGTEYYIVSFLEESQFSITASENDTEINIEFPVSVSLKDEVLYEGVTFLNPATLNIFLHMHDVFHLHVPQDLTGVFLSSNKPVAVIAGNRKIPIGTGNKDHLAQQMPPVNTWGTTFISVPSPTKVAPDVYRILTSGANTTITIGNATHTLENKGDWMEVELSPSLPVALQSDTPVLVAKYVANDKRIEPCLLLVVPTEQWNHEYSFMFPQGSSKGYLLVVIETHFRESLLLNSETLNIQQWVEAENTNTSVGYIQLINGYYTIQSRDINIVFAAYMHQTIRKYPFCTAVGMNMKAINTNWNHPKVSGEPSESPRTVSTPIPTSTVVGVTVYPTSGISGDHTTLSSSSDVTITPSATDVDFTSSGQATETKAYYSTDTTVPYDTTDTIEATTDESITNPGATQGLQDITYSTVLTLNEKCPCVDNCQRSTSSISTEEMQILIASLQGHLRVIPNQTSRAIRMKISIPDYRPSSMVFGVAGWSVVLVVVGLTCLNDIPRVLSDLRHGVQRFRMKTLS